MTARVGQKPLHPLVAVHLADRGVLFEVLDERQQIRTHLPERLLGHRGLDHREECHWMSKQNCVTACSSVKSIFFP